MSRGYNGFDELGVPDFALGSVRGVRWWKLSGWPDGEISLTGAHDRWQPGENVADCVTPGFRFRPDPRSPAEPAHAVPGEDCGCGFWAYWTVTDSPLGETGMPVLGVIEGYGPTLIGDKGFRSARARIVALHLAFTFTADKPGPQRDPDPPPACVSSRGPEGAAAWRALTGRGKSGRSPVEQVTDDSCIARLAALECALEDRYGVPVCGTQGYLLAKYPPTADYLPSPEP